MTNRRPTRLQTGTTKPPFASLPLTINPPTERTLQLLDRLVVREKEGNPVRAGLVGCGQEGSGMVHITNQMAGMDTFAIADIDVERPKATFAAIGVPASRVCITNDLGRAADALRDGKRVVTEDALLLPQLEALDAVVEATGVTDVGAQVAWNCILNRKHVVMLNVETDVTAGLILATMAEKAGCVYTVSTGDEPGVCKQLFDFSRILGFEVVCLGKGKNNPINHYATPDTAREEAERRHMNPKMLAAFQDGTKTMVELAAMSNATGLLPDIAGCHGPKVDLPDLNRVLVPSSDGGLLSRRGCVDYSVGKVAPSVFAIIATDDAHVVHDLQFYAMGDGPYYTLHRPYHLCSIETPLAIAEAVIYGESTLVPMGRYAEVISVAKRDLKAGQKVEGIGGRDLLGRIYTHKEAHALGGVPVGLAAGGTVLQDIAKDEVITADRFAPDATQFVYKLRQMQDTLS
jgi:predicted homoserine dehydrogenase-like protein